MNQSTANNAPRAASRPAEQLLESLSALMDDEADLLEMRRVVKSLPESPALSDHWRRYHAVRASLRQETHIRPSIDLLPGIRSRLQQQHETVARVSLTQRFNGRLVRFIGQGAIAASVAGAVLLGYPLLQTGNTAGSNMVAAVDELPELSGDYTASPFTRTVSLDAQARDRLQQAVYEFSGTSAVLDAQTPMFPQQLEPFDPEAEGSAAE